MQIYTNYFNTLPAYHNYFRKISHYLYNSLSFYQNLTNFGSNFKREQLFNNKLLDHENQESF